MPLPTGSSSDKTVKVGRSPVVQHEADGCIIGTLDDILLVLWTKQPRLEQVLELRRVMDLVSYKLERGASVHVLYNRPELPEKRMRDEMARVTQAYADRTTALALVLVWRGLPGERDARAGHELALSGQQADALQIQGLRDGRPGGEVARACAERPIAGPLRRGRDRGRSEPSMRASPQSAEGPALAFSQQPAAGASV